MQRRQHFAPIAFGQSGFAYGQTARRHHAKADRFTMQEVSVTSSLLDGMADGVPEIEQRAEIVPLEFVRRDDLGLDL